LVWFFIGASSFDAVAKRKERKLALLPLSVLVLKRASHR
jgi:hypothetical protein